jgi:hypothetical protein
MKISPFLDTESYISTLKITYIAEIFLRILHVLIFNNPMQSNY